MISGVKVPSATGVHDVMFLLCVTPYHWRTGEHAGLHP